MESYISGVMQSSENFEFSENLERLEYSENSENLEYSENLEFSENLENFEYSLYSDNGGSHNKTLWCGNYVKPWAVTIPHNASPHHSKYSHIPLYSLIFLPIPPYPHLISTILSISTVFSIFRHIPPLQINYYVQLAKA